jgi:hypothetical protein
LRMIPSLHAIPGPRAAPPGLLLTVIGVNGRVDPGRGVNEDAGRQTRWLWSRQRGTHSFGRVTKAISEELNAAIRWPTGQGRIIPDPLE